jgi:hypothetical protein
MSETTHGPGWLSFARLSRLERRCLSPEAFTTDELAWMCAPLAEREEYIRWLEQQTGELFASLN